MKAELIKFFSMLRRNIKLYFADKTVFFVSLMAPMILLLLFVLFLRKIYVDSLSSMIPEGIPIGGDLIEAFVAGWLASSIMSVSCVTVSLGACIIMVQDKIKGTLSDISASPIKSGTVFLSYYAATFISAIAVVLIMLALCLIYIAICGWHISASQIFLLLLNTVLLTLFGCAAAAIINSFIRSEGGVTAVSALSSSVYGFICGAYMPLSQFGTAFSNIFGFNPGLYACILFRRLFIGGALNQMSSNLPTEAVTAIRDGYDLNFYFFGASVSESAMWTVLLVSVAVMSLLMLLVANRKHIIKKLLRGGKN